MLPVVKLPLLVIVTSPASPDSEKEDNSPKEDNSLPVVSIFPFVLSRLILPPRPLPLERESISPVVKLPLLVIVTSPAFPDSEKEDNLP